MLDFDLVRIQFKTARRRLLKDRQFSLLNIIGLSIGIASALLIGLWVNAELAFDKFHEKDSRLYEVMIHERMALTLRLQIVPVNTLEKPSVIRCRRSKRL